MQDELALLLSVGDKVKTYALQINGYSFHVLCDPKDINDYLLDGIDIQEVIMTVPEWWVDRKLPVRLWKWLQKAKLVWL